MGKEIKLKAFNDRFINTDFLEGLKKDLSEAYGTEFDNAGVTDGYSWGAIESVSFGSNNSYVSFSISPFTGNCGAGIISHLSYTAPKKDETEKVMKAINKVIDICFKNFGSYPISGIYMTLEKYNDNRIKQLTENGWRILGDVWTNHAHPPSSKIVTLFKGTGCE